MTVMVFAASWLLAVIHLILAAACAHRAWSRDGPLAGDPFRRSLHEGFFFALLGFAVALIVYPFVQA